MLHKKIYTLSLACFLCLFLHTRASADTIPIASAEGLHVIQAVEGYLNRLQTMRSRFVQVNYDGSSTEGIFLLKRPGKMFIEYDAPVPFLMYADGIFFAHVDKELEEISYLPLSDAIVWPLLKETVYLRDKSITIDRIDLENGVLRVAIRQDDKPEQGILDLIFNPDPLFLKQWFVTDAQRRTTIVTLLNPVSNVHLDDSEFRYKAPWKDKRRNEK